MPRSRRPILTRCARPMTTATLLAALAGPAGALDIIFTPLSANTNPNINSTNPAASGYVDADFMANDINSAGLLAVLNHIGSVYENAIEDPGTVEITYWWDRDMTLIGQSSPSWIVESGNRVTMSGVRFQADLINTFGTNWFIDPTPANDNEFDMQQTLFRDLSANAQTGRYQGATPDLFEAAFSGSDNGNAPAGAFMDLLSVAFQEVGHALGMNSGFSNVSNGSGTGEGDDFKFDIPTSWVHGNSMDLLARGWTNPTAGDGKDHIVGNNVVMGGVLQNQRNRPSAADLLVIAVTGNYNDIDLPRKDFLGGTQWNSGYNWLGGAVPDANDEVFIRHGSGSAVLLDSAGNTSVHDLTVDESSDLFITNGGTLYVGHNAVVQNTGGGAIGTSNITVDANSELNANDLRIHDGGNVSVFNGLVDADTLLITAGGSITGNGIVRFVDVMRNDGEIAATRPFGLGISTLTITSLNGVGIDLDGNAENGVVTADFADLVVAPALTDDFNGTMNIGAGHFVSMAHAWMLGGSGGAQDGRIDMDGGNANADRARLIGAPFTVDGGEINATGLSQINTTATILAQSQIIVNSGANLEFNNPTTLEAGTFNVAANANLEFNGDTTVQSAQFNIDPTGVVSFDGNTTYTYNTTINANGLIQQTGDATIIGAMAVNGGRFDLDGYNGTTVINLGNSANSGWLTLNVDGVDSADNRFDGTINTKDAGLTGGMTVNLPAGQSWQMDGVLNLETSNALISIPARINGSKMRVSGIVNVANGGTRIAADVDFLSTATVNTAALGAQLHLSGETHVFSGATFTGLGTIVNRNDGTIALHAFADTDFVGLENRGNLRIGENVGDTARANVHRYWQTEDATLEIELAGPFTQGALLQPFDQLIVEANAYLDGGLELTLLPGYTAPKPYRDHTILQATGGAVSGTFATIDGVQYAPGMGLAVTYTPNSVVVTAAMLGDTDLDGDIDDSDLGNSFANYTGPVGAAGHKTWADGDTDGDGDVDDSDLGSSFAGYTGPLSPTSVPEPASLVLVVLGFAGCCRRRRGVLGGLA